MSVRRKHIRGLVEQLLDKYQLLAAPVDIESLVSQLGAEVRYQPADPDLSGFLLRDPKQPKAIIGINSNHHSHRQRFTVAHELGHLLLHEGEAIHIDRLDRGFQVNMRNQDSSKGIDMQEKEANLFAAEVLMPIRFLAQDLTQYDSLDLLGSEVESTLKPLATLYQVSTQALTFRLAYLNYIQI